MFRTEDLVASSFTFVLEVNSNFFTFFPHIAPDGSANINMSKLDSAYDIDPLFHKMSKSFDEGGAKGLLLGNLGVSTSGCHVVFDSKEAAPAAAAEKKPELEKIEEGAEEDEAEEEGTAEEDEAGAGPAWKESQIDITSLSAKLEQMLASYGHETSATVPFVPQLESLRQDYARLEEEGYGVDEYSCESPAAKPPPNYCQCLIAPQNQLPFFFFSKYSHGGGSQASQAVRRRRGGRAGG